MTNYFHRYLSTKNLRELSAEAKHQHKAFWKKARRALKGCRAAARDRDFLKRLAGRTDRLPLLLGSEGRARYEVMELTFRALRDLMHADSSLQFLFVTIINAHWDTSDEVTRIPLAAMQAMARRIATRMSPDWIGVAELQVFSNVRHPAGGKLLSPHCHIVVFGHDIAARAQRAAAECNARMRTSIAVVQPVSVRPIDPTLLDLARVTKYMFKTPGRCKNLYVSPAKGISTINESEKGDRFVRYLRLLQLLSLLQLDRLLFAGGTGTRIRADALRQVHNQREVVTGRVKRADVMANVNKFWTEMMPRLSLNRFRMPTIK